MIEQFNPYKFDGKCEYGNGFYSGYCKCQSHRRDREYYNNNNHNHNSHNSHNNMKSSMSSSVLQSLIEYSLLGLIPPVTEHELKKAYHKKALDYHPDKTNGDSEMFIKIKDAYDIISSSL